MLGEGSRSQTDVRVGFIRGEVRGLKQERDEGFSPGGQVGQAMERKCWDCAWKAGGRVRWGGEGGES